MRIAAKKNIIPITFSIFVILGFTIFLIRNIEDYLELFSFSLIRVLLLIAAICISTFINGLINYYLYGALGITLKLRTGFGLAVVNTMANLLPFAGGLVAKGVYLNKKHHLEYTKYTSSIGALFICFVATNGLIGLFGLLLIAIFHFVEIPLIIILGFGLMAGSIVLLWIPLRFGFLPDKWQNRMNSFNQGWQVFRNDRRLLLKLIILQIASVLTMAFRFWIGFRFLSFSVSFLEGLLFASATILTRLVSIAPGGLGVREAIIAVVGNFLGYDP